MNVNLINPDDRYKDTGIASFRYATLAMTLFVSG